MVQPLDLRRRHARKTLDAKQRVGIGKGSEAGTVYLDRRAGLFGHMLPDATRLDDRDAVTDDEGTGRLIGRVKEHRTKMCVLGLEPADNGIAASDLAKPWPSTSSETVATACCQARSAADPGP